MSQSIFISAGELSGDLHAARVMKALHAGGGSWTAFGLGGDALAQEKVTLIEHIDRLSLMGFGALVGKVNFFRRLMKSVLEQVDTHRPDCALLVDYPGFNLALAGALKKRGIPVYWYISPKVWIWKKKRVKKMKRWIDCLMVIFPFEVEFFRREGMEARYVGNPLIEEMQPYMHECSEQSNSSARPYIALLPGSRAQEIKQILPLLVSAAERLALHRDIDFIIAAPNKQIADLIQRYPRPPSIKMVIGKTQEVVRDAKQAWIASGTATLEAALIGTPHVLVYRTDPLTAWIFNYLLKVNYVGLVNILAQQEVCKELLQREATPESVLKEALCLLDEREAQTRQLTAFDQIRHDLGAVHSSAAVAAILQEQI
jgi:lipid-A-disaccharide synthase